MASRSQLVLLHRRMVRAQRELIDQPAEAGTLPTRQALSHLADYEQAIIAIETMIEEQKLHAIRREPAEMLAAAE